VAGKNKSKNRNRNGKRGPGSGGRSQRTASPPAPGSSSSAPADERPLTGAEAGAGAGAATTPAGPSPAWRIVGAGCLLISTAAALVLSLSHLGSPPPGCGPESACAKVTSSVWGRVPLIEWPTAFVGAAWFAGLLVGWLLSGGRLGRATWILAGLGGAMSLLLLGVMLVDGTLCPWCMASHAGNLGFLGVALLSVDGIRVPRAPGGRRGVLALASVAAAVTVGLAVANTVVTGRERERDEALTAAATEEIIAAGRAAAATPTPTPAPDATGDPAAAERPSPAIAPDAPASAPAPVSPPNAGDGRPPFTGRWRLGPERAPIRFVVFLDFQCPDCRTVETQLAELVRSRTDVSLSLKHFPFNSPCNRLARSLNFNPHPNACWAARASEAAGILGGQDGFWRMNEALFARQGAFTDAELAELVAAEGFDPALFVRTMTSPLTLQRVEADVEEGIALGLASTPTLFVNGVELGGWRVPGALERTIERLAEEDLPVLSAAEAGDQPPTASAKFVNSWSTSRRIPGAALSREPAAAPAAMFGGEGDVAGAGSATVIVFGDLSDPQTRSVDARVRTRAERDARVRYVFRHLPLDPACNPQTPSARNTGGCLAARIATAAGRLGGPEAARAAHRVLIARPTPIDASAIEPVAAAAGLSTAALAAGLADPATEAALAEDRADAGLVRTGRRIVTVIVDGRIPSRLEYDTVDLLQRTIDRAIDEG
jgi:protein-disulfide isomerase/uncharacterized membrane protein